MARQIGSAVHSKFDQGYITEATALNFPPNAVTDTENCVFHFTGNLTRRLGFNFEIGSQILNLPDLGIPLDEGSISSFYWQNASGIGSVNFAVVQIGAFILFFQVGVSTALSAGFTGQFLDMNDFAAPNNPGVEGEICQYAAGDGYLFIAHPYCDPVFVSYDQTTGTFTPTQVSLKIRDFTGVPDVDPVSGLNMVVGNGLSDRPTVLTANHYYNLYNQGWFIKDWSTYQATFNSNGTTIEITVPLFFTQSYIQLLKTDGAGVFPSNADVWWRFKDEGGGYNPVTQVGNVQLGNTRAPQGFFILDAFNQDRSAAVQQSTGTAIYGGECNGLPVVTSGYFRPQTIAFFAGRVFYAGVQDPAFANYIYFSRIVEQPQHIGQCYSDDDPTASDTGVADILASDGGYVKSPDFGVVYKLYALAYSLLVFTSKGVWSISGSTGFGFTATDYSISKISSIPMLNPQAFIDLDGAPVWWNDDGIYTLQAGGMVAMTMQQVKPITYPTIQTFFNTIPPDSKAYATGVYNRSEHTIYWLYSANAPTDVTSRYRYDSVLLQNTLTGAFYKWTLPYNSQLDRYIAGALVIYGTGTEFTQEPVSAADGTVVTISTGDQVTVDKFSTSYIGQVTKFIVVQTLGT